MTMQMSSLLAPYNAEKRILRSFEEASRSSGLLDGELARKVMIDGQKFLMVPVDMAFILPTLSSSGFR